MMSKYSNLHIRKSEVKETINDFCRNSFDNFTEIEGPELINKANNQTRYCVVLNDFKFGPLQSKLA